MSLRAADDSQILMKINRRFVRGRILQKKRIRREF